MSRRRKNTFTKAISHIKSTKFDMVEDAPTNRTSGFMTITPNSPNPDYVPPHYPAPEDLPDFSIDGEDGKDWEWEDKGMKVVPYFTLVLRMI